MVIKKGLRGSPFLRRDGKRLHGDFHEMGNTICLPAGFSMVRAGIITRDGSFAVGDNLDTFFADAHVHEVHHCCFGAFLTKNNVVCIGSALVGMTGNDNLD